MRAGTCPRVSLQEDEMKEITSWGVGKWGSEGKRLKAANPGALGGDWNEFSQGNARMIANTYFKGSLKGARELGCSYANCSQSLRAAPKDWYQFPGSSCLPHVLVLKNNPGMQRLAAEGQQVHPEGHGCGLAASVLLTAVCPAPRTAMGTFRLSINTG